MIVVAVDCVVVVVLVVVDVVFVVDVEVGVVDVDFVVQDAKTRDVTIRQVSTIQITPLFIQTPLYFWNTTNLYFRQLLKP